MMRGHSPLVLWRPRRLPTAHSSLWGRVRQNERRALHTVRPLPYALEEGLGRFMPPQALKTVAVEYMEGLVDRLNNEIRDTELENKRLVDVIIGAAQQESQVLAFNYGSLALNTSFFLRQLKPPPAIYWARQERDIIEQKRNSVPDADAEDFMQALAERMPADHPPSALAKKLVEYYDAAGTLIAAAKEYAGLPESSPERQELLDTAAQAARQATEFLAGHSEIQESLTNALRAGANVPALEALVAEGGQAIFGNHTAALSTALNAFTGTSYEYAETHERSMSYDLKTAIRAQYGSLAQLKSAFMGAAQGMFTSGFLWLVSDSRGNMGIVPTFGPGTLLIRSRAHLAASDADFKVGTTLRPHPDRVPQEIANQFMSEEEEADDTPQRDPLGLESVWLPEFAQLRDNLAQRLREQAERQGLRAAEDASSDSSSASPAPKSGPSGSRSFSTSAAVHNVFNQRPNSIMDENADFAESMSNLDEGVPAQVALTDKLTALNYGDVLYPLLCVPMYEHTWISAGYGVWGREAWLRHLWSVVDWAAVSENYAAASPAAPSKQKK